MMRAFRLSSRRVSIALLIAVCLLVVVPTFAEYFGGDYYRVGLSGISGSRGIGLTSGSNSLNYSMLPGSAERAAAVDMVQYLTIAIALGIFLGVLTTFISGNPLLGLVSTIMGIIGVLFVNAVIGTL